QHDPCTSQSGTPYYLPQGNFINDQGQGSFSAEPTVPSHIPVPVPEDDQITFTAASLTGQQNGHFSLSTTDAPVTSYPVAEVLLGLPQMELVWEPLHLTMCRLTCSVG
uniref:Uncharacterized protein n=1 Tax=Aegilops tauschii subsp. strangulata TaxID=200361 RepID=A0A453LY74_AEGTS